MTKTPPTTATTMLASILILTAAIIGHRAAADGSGRVFVVAHRARWTMTTLLPSMRRRSRRSLPNTTGTTITTTRASFATPPAFCALRKVRE